MKMLSGQSRSLDPESNSSYYVESPYVEPFPGTTCGGSVPDLMEAEKSVGKVLSHYERVFDIPS